MGTKERRFWIYAAAVAMAIFATLLMGRPLQHMLRDQNVQAVFFLSGMLLVGGAILVHGLRLRPSKRELAVWIGLAAVFVMFVFRLGAPERSHLIEYSVLAIFIHKALGERWAESASIWRTALMAWLFTFLIGVVDEGLQYWLPDRVFDTEDIVFNGIAATMAIGGSLIVNWARRRFGRE